MTTFKCLPLKIKLRSFSILIITYNVQLRTISPKYISWILKNVAHLYRNISDLLKTIEVL